MRVQPDWPMRPFTAMTMRAGGLAVVTCERGEHAGAAGAEDEDVAVRSSMGSIMRQGLEDCGGCIGVWLA